MYTVCPRMNPLPMERAKGIKLVPLSPEPREDGMQYMMLGQG